MSARTLDRASTIVSAAGWVGFVGYFLLLQWKHLSSMNWLFGTAFTLMVGLALLVFALEVLSEEMTVRRWATTTLIFLVFGVILLLGGIFDLDSIHLPRGGAIVAGVYYLVAAALAGAGAKDLF